MPATLLKVVIFPPARLGYPVERKHQCACLMATNPLVLACLETLPNNSQILLNM